MMDSVRRAWNRVLAVFRRAPLDTDLDAEIASHIESAIEENLRRGMAPEEARRQALVRFGGVAGAMEQHREARGLPALDILDNAIKYTPAGGRITVGAKPAGNVVELFVRDSGIGIPEEDLPRLFERFYGVDKARSRELGGTGLGLSIVKHLVAVHHGVARVESVLRRGSTFYFTLPVEEKQMLHAEEPANPAETMRDLLRQADLLTKRLHSRIAPN